MPFSKIKYLINYKKDLMFLSKLVFLAVLLVDYKFRLSFGVINFKILVYLVCCLFYSAYCLLLSLCCTFRYIHKYAIGPPRCTCFQYLTALNEQHFSNFKIDLLRINEWKYDVCTYPWRSDGPCCTFKLPFWLAF